MKLLTPNMPTFSRPQKEVALLEVVRKQLIRGTFILMIIINVFLFLRFFLRLFGADPANPFAAFIFFVSQIIMLPAIGIFPRFRDEIIPGEMTFDLSAFVTGFCYNILLMSFLAVLQIITSMVRTRKQADETIKKDKPINLHPVDQIFSHHKP